MVLQRALVCAGLFAGCTLYVLVHTLMLSCREVPEQPVRGFFGSNWHPRAAGDQRLISGSANNAPPWRKNRLILSGFQFLGSTWLAGAKTRQYAGFRHALVSSLGKYLQIPGSAAW